MVRAGRRSDFTDCCFLAAVWHVRHGYVALSRTSCLLFRFGVV